MEDTLWGSLSARACVRPGVGLTYATNVTERVSGRHDRGKQVRETGGSSLVTPTPTRGMLAKAQSDRYLVLKGGTSHDGYASGRGTSSSAAADAEPAERHRGTSSSAAADAEPAERHRAPF